MGFDQDDPRPIVNVHKRTTKVNIWMAVAVFAFFALGASLILLFVRWYGHT